MRAKPKGKQQNNFTFFANSFFISYFLLQFLNFKQVQVRWLLADQILWNWSKVQKQQTSLITLLKAKGANLCTFLVLSLKHINKNCSKCLKMFLNIFCLYVRIIEETDHRLKWKDVDLLEVSLEASFNDYQMPRLVLSDLAQYCKLKGNCFLRYSHKC